MQTVKAKQQMHAKHKKFRKQKTWHFVKNILVCEEGQASVEFAVVVFGLLGIVLALLCLWDVISGGLFIEHALRAASHNLASASAFVIVDILGF